MYKNQIEKTLSDGRSIVCFTRNGNAKNASGATIMLLGPGISRQLNTREQRKLGGVLAEVETSCYMGNVGWSRKKELELIAQ